MNGAIDRDLDERGFAVVTHLLASGECRELRDAFEEERHFRSRIDMARYRFGQGEYKYFDYPLPAVVSSLRERFYGHLLPIARSWSERLAGRAFPDSHAEFLGECRRLGQERATPLLLHYRAGDFNCLHQDLYGQCVFPLQLVVLLSEPGVDFEGGELVLTEQRPRAQSRVSVVPLKRGDAAVIASHNFPRHGTRGTYRANLRHGVSEVRRGERFSLGIIFHDAA
jgi:hypothetical protein